MTVITPLGSFMIVAFIVLAVVASIVAIGVLTHFVVSNRRARLARHESVRSYYRNFALTS